MDHSTPIERVYDLTSPNANRTRENIAPGPGRGVGKSIGVIASASTGLASALLSIVVGACCVSPVLAPIIVSVLGASGAVWAAGLKPYSWWLLGGSFVCLALGFWSVYRPRTACETSKVPRSDRALQLTARGSLWIGAVFWIAGMTVRVLVA